MNLEPVELTGTVAAHDALVIQLVLRTPEVEYQPEAAPYKRNNEHAWQRLR